MLAVLWAKRKRSEIHCELDETSFLYLFVRFDATVEIEQLRDTDQGLLFLWLALLPFIVPTQQALQCQAFPRWMFER